MKVIYDEYKKVTWPCSNCVLLDISNNTCDNEKCIYPRAYCASKEQHTEIKEKSKGMEDRRFEILRGNNRLATDMRLEDALLFINAIFDKYYMEHSMVISIKEMERLNEELS